MTSHIDNSPARSLVRAVAAAFTLKMLAVLALYAFFFAPGHRPSVDPDRWFDAAAPESPP